MLQSERTKMKVKNNNQLVDYNVPRNYPPCVLEWRANRNRVNMALNVGFYDGQCTCTILYVLASFNYTTLVRMSACQNNRAA